MDSNRSGTGTQTEYDYLFKSKVVVSPLVIITGDACCGKSRILERYVYDRFSEKAPATIGVEFIPKNVALDDGTRVRLQLWDTGKPQSL